MTHSPEVQALMQAASELSLAFGFAYDSKAIESATRKVIEARRALDPKPEAPEMVWVNVCDDYDVSAHTSQSAAEADAGDMVKRTAVPYVPESTCARLVKGGVEGRFLSGKDFSHPVWQKNELAAKSAVKEWPGASAIYLAQVEPK